MYERSYKFPPVKIKFATECFINHHLLFIFAFGTPCVFSSVNETLRPLRGVLLMNVTQNCGKTTDKL